MSIKDKITSTLRALASELQQNRVASFEPDNSQLSDNFTLAEFSCNHCGKNAPNIGMPPQSLIDALENVRTHFGNKPVIVMSGYRCPVHNKNVGGAARSRHMIGDAADIKVKDVHPHVVYEYLDTLIDNKGGVGKYDTFTHVDVRGYKARW